MEQISNLGILNEIIWNMLVVFNLYFLFNMTTISFSHFNARMDRQTLNIVIFIVH